jgi:acetoacetate decarboxylase
MAGELSIHELEYLRIFYNTNLGLLPQIISCFLEVHNPIVQLPLEDKLLYRWTSSREQAVDLW